jgi:glycosyltransferase involved in cell wall biosynthesis
MKICFVSFEYPPFVIGGAGIYAKCLCFELSRYHEVHVLAPYIPGVKPDCAKSGLFVHRVPFIRKRFISFPTYLVALRKYFKQLEKRIGGFDIIHGNGLSCYSLSKNFVKVPMVATVHHLVRSTVEELRPTIEQRILNMNGEEGLLTELIEKTVVSRADKIIAVSKFTKQSLLTTYGVPSSKVEVIHNGIYPEEYEYSERDVSEIKDILGIDCEKMILFVGRLEARKNLAVLVKAYSLVCQKSNAKLVIAGGGNQEPLINLARNLGVENGIVFTGHVDDKTLKVLYGACDVFVLPSLLEGFGLVLLEAMAAGKPVVASNKGGIPEVINGSESLIDPHNPKELANALIFYLERGGLSEEVGKRNKKYVVDNFSWKKNAELTEKLYTNLLSGSST